LRFVIPWVIVCGPPAYHGQRIGLGPVQAPCHGRNSRHATATIRLSGGTAGKNRPVDQFLPNFGSVDKLNVSTGVRFQKPGRGPHPLHRRRGRDPRLAAIVPASQWVWPVRRGNACQVHESRRFLLRDGGLSRPTPGPKSSPSFAQALPANGATPRPNWSPASPYLRGRISCSAPRHSGSKTAPFAVENLPMRRRSGDRDKAANAFSLTVRTDQSQSRVFITHESLSQTRPIIFGDTNTSTIAIRGLLMRLICRMVGEGPPPLACDWWIGTVNRSRVK